MQESIQQLLQQMSAAGEFSGVVVVRQGEREVYAGAFGWANRAFRVPNRLDTRFGHASVTKMFTAVAVLQLAAQGRLTLETPVVRRLGLEGSAISSEVTVHHLLCHTSGIADYFDDDDPAALERLLGRIPRESLRSVGGFLPLFMDRPAHFAPGARFEYNSAGYILLGLLIEAVTGLSYYDYVRSNIFARAGMDGADFIPFDQVQERVAEGYIPHHDPEGRLTGWRRNIYAVPPAGSPDGGAFATAGDLLRFMAALRAGELLPPDWVAAMQRPHAAVAPGFFYGYGLWILSPAGQVVRYGHTGEDPGVSARVMHYPQHGLDLVILGNQSDCAGPVLAQLHRWITAE